MLLWKRVSQLREWYMIVFDNATSIFLTNK